MTVAAARRAEGRCFDKLRIGVAIDAAPALTLTDGHAALHQAIAGDRLQLTLDATLAAEVAGAERPLAHPALVWEVAIGQSALATDPAVASLSYRGLVLRRLPEIGDTLRTTTQVVALREAPARTGVAVLRVSTTDQAGRPVLELSRCVMAPHLNAGAAADRLDGLDPIPDRLGAGALGAAVAGWRLERLRDRCPGGDHFADLEPGRRWQVAGGDVVSCAPELSRLSLNAPIAHHDAGADDGRRVVDGGHTVAIAAAQASRALPSLATILGWHRCDHLAPVHEGDTLRSELEIERCDPLPDGGGLVHLRSRVRADRDGEPVDVLDWRFAGAMA